MDRPLSILLRDLGRFGPRLAGAGLLYRAVAFAVLTPLVGLLVRVLLAASGRTVLADLDIALLLLRPAAWLAVVAVTAAALSIVMLEQACFLAVAAPASDDDNDDSGRPALQVSRAEQN